MGSEEILRLLQIVNLAKDWPDFRPIHDRARDKLLEVAKNPEREHSRPAPAITKKEI